MSFNHIESSGFMLPESDFIPFPKIAIISAFLQVFSFQFLYLGFLFCVISGIPGNGQKF